MYIGIDVGGSYIRIASFKSLDSPEFDNRVRLKVANDYKKDLELITQNILNLSKEKIDSIGIGVPAVLNKEKTQTIFANNLVEWNNRDIKKDLEEIFKCSVVLENDATAAAVGEAYFGHGGGKDFLFVIWGTGIGGTFIKRLNDSIYPESSELGHQIIKLNGLPDSCGQKGCLEAYCGGATIEKNYQKKAENLTDEEWGEVEKMLAQGMINAIAVHPVELVVFAGGVALNQEKRIHNLQTLLNESLKIVSVPRLELSKLKENVGVCGALACLKL
jgi:glucokinase